MCLGQTQPRKHGLGHADGTPPTWQHELDHANHTDHTYRVCIYRSALNDLDHDLYR